MNQKLNNLLIILLAFILIIVFTPYFGRLYELLVGHKMSSSFWGPSHPEYFVGFFISYMFFISLLFTFFGVKNKYKRMLILLGILLLLDLFLGAWEGLIIDLGAAVIGWLLGRGGLLIYKGLKNSW